MACRSFTVLHEQIKLNYFFRGFHIQTIIFSFQFIFF